mgnify:CR=1 FL=1
MLINLSELFPVEGKSKTYTPELEMTQFRMADTVYDIAEKGPLSLMITNRGNKKLTLAGTADLVLIMPCARCLDPVRVPFQLEIDQELDMNQSDEERVEDLDEQPYVNGYKLDIDQLVGNELTLNLPMKVLCSEDCQGISNRYGTNPGSGEGDCKDSMPDPRMSVIQDIFKQLKEV